MIKWIKDKIIWLLFGSIALASTTIALLDTPQIESDLVSLENIIKTDLQDDGKYIRQDPQTIKGVEYEVHEYETSKGETGYTIFMTKEEDNKVYKKAISTGVQKESREFDWKYIKDVEIISEIATTTTK